ncbi:ANTAR domain-containing protein [Mycolicibacterium stellerae]|uniref:ANTAR domain-containing protein n=1 Tax=Mycolicibacterium stellerae TaxID=2358193 RepID=UPI000F0AF6DF|nr:ANTAR domain-containing protein [Mycolicibacterium stellerae]
MTSDWTSQNEADAITAFVADMAEHRAVVEQAKGVLMVVYDIDADAALDLLKWRSQATDTELQALAGRLMKDFRLLHWSDKRSSRLMFDRMLLTAHERLSEP